MIFLIGGASRSGKSTLAKRLVARLGIPLVELDYLKMGLANGLPSYGVHPLDDEHTIGALLGPIVSSMIRAMVENEDDYILEGTYILPVYADECHKRYGGVIRSCFLGYADTAPSGKMAEVKKYRDEAGSPFRGCDDETMRSDIEQFVWLSGFLRDECNRLGLTYLEATDREAALDRAMGNLLDDGEGVRSPGRTE